jgi:hypothetical protein
VIGDECTCGKCGKNYLYKRNGCSKTLCSACRQSLRLNKVKQKAIEYMGGKCLVCGYDKSTASLDFHHLDETTKEFGFSGNYNISWTRFQKELDKCVLVCANCHREIHCGIIQL